MMALLMDRGDSYTVKYLGSNMLAMTALTGLGVLQKPLKEMYYQYRHAAGRSSVRLQERHLMMNKQGLVMTYENSKDHTKHEELYRMPDILFWDAVKFVTLKGTDRKLKSAFGPLDNTHSRNKDNLFATLEKQYQFLHKEKHQAMFCCVLRRTQGVKALDVHAFVCSTNEEAIGLVRALNAVSNSYAIDEQQETGVFGYNPFGNENVRSTAGLEGVTESRQAHTRGETRHKSSDRDKAARPVSVRDKHRSAKSKDNNLITGSQPNLFSDAPGSGPSAQAQSRQQGPGAPRDRNSRVFMLSQEDFFDQDPRPNKQSENHEHKSRSPRRTQSAKIKSNAAVRETYDYLKHINRTLERPNHRDSDSERQVPIHYNSEPSYTDNASSDTSNNLTFSGGGIFQEDRQFTGRKPSKKSEPSSNSNVSMGQGYSLLSSSSGVLPGYAPHQNTRRPYAPSLTEETQPYETSLPGNPRVTPDSARRNNAMYENIDELGGSLRARMQQLGRSDPGVQRGPIIPPRSPITGRNESFRRDANASPERRSTKQGTVMAQVTPQAHRGSSPFANSLGPPGVTRLGSSEKRWDSDSPGVSRSNIEAQNSKPVAKVSPHKIQGVKVLPSMPSVVKKDNSPMNLNNAKRYDNSSNSSVSSPPKRPHSMYVTSSSPESRNFTPKNFSVPEQKRISPVDNSPVKDIYALPNKKPSKLKEQPRTRAEEKNWQFQNNTKSSADVSGSGTNMNDSGRGENMIQSGKKDAEIASLLQNIHFDYEATMSPHAPHGTNFEKSLGYFP